MPNEDKTGPEGDGPLTGQGLGKCDEKDGQVQDLAAGQGYGKGRGRGRGRGRGCRLIKSIEAE